VLKNHTRGCKPIECFKRYVLKFLRSTVKNAATVEMDFSYHHFFAAFWHDTSFSHQQEEI
jgi:hypothetical protein